MSKNKEKFTVGIYHIPNKSPRICIFFRTDGIGAEGYCFVRKEWSRHWALLVFEKSI